MEFFQRLALMGDREEFSLKAKKVGDDLVTTIVKDKKVTNITIPKDDLNSAGIDDKVFMEIRAKATAEPVKFQATQTDAQESDEDEEKEEKKSGSKKPAAKSKAQPKKKEAKKPAKKAPAKKAAAKSKAPKKGLKDLLNKENDAAAAKKVAGVQKTDESVTQSPETVTNVQENVTKVEKSEIVSYDEQFKQHMAAGHKLFQEKEYAESEAEFQKAVDLKPDDQQAKTQLANSRRWAKAMSNIKK